MLILVILIFSIIAYFFFTKETYINMKSDCGLYFKVINDNDAKQTANILADINRKCNQLIKHIKHKYPDDDRIKILIDRYDNDDLVENRKESFTINKGHKIHLCVRDHNDFYPDNLLMFIVLHELAHIITKKINHPVEFWDNNIWIMNEAYNCNVFKPVNYKLYPVNYCGINININPYFNK